jgi:hypothetical protein
LLLAQQRKITSSLQALLLEQRQEQQQVRLQQAWHQQRVRQVRPERQQEQQQVLLLFCRKRPGRLRASTRSEGTSSWLFPLKTVEMKRFFSSAAAKD